MEVEEEEGERAHIGFLLRETGLGATEEKVDGYALLHHEETLPGQHSLGVSMAGHGAEALT